MTNRTGKYDASLAGAWWVGDMVAGGHLLSYDKFYDDPRFPKWDFDDVLPGPRSLMSYGGKRYMVANDHDGQVMYYRRDLLERPAAPGGVPAQVRLRAGGAADLGAVPRCRRVLQRAGSERRRHGRSRHRAGV